MSQIFHPATNTFARVSIFGAILIFSVVGWILFQFNRSPYITQASVAREQPIPFSHKHHVQGLGMDCRYCHTSVEESSFAGIPSTSTCMNCHSVVWKDAPILEPLRESFRTGQAIPWIRIHDLPDFVYFDHSIHVSKGVECITCHGDVGNMPLMWRQQTLHMDWCLSCHRNPEKFVGAAAVKSHNIKKMTNCTVCHR